jgi:AraC family transcriptional regulator
MHYGGVDVELVQRRLDGAPATIHVWLAQHTLYAQLSGGFLYERQVSGLKRECFASEPQLMSFRPAGSEVLGTTTGSGIVTYGVISIDPLSSNLQDSFAELPPKLNSFTGLRNPRLWDELAPLLAECGTHSPPPRPLAHLYVHGRVIALLALLAEEAGWVQPGNGLDRRIRDAIEWIGENLTREFTIHELASVANLSASQLVRLFRKSLGVTPTAYVSNVRLREAQRLLAHSDWTITQIATHLGYVDQSHFTLRFRTHTGLTPAAYRRARASS